MRHEVGLKREELPLIAASALIELNSECAKGNV